ncbi:hypothetical protein PM8797T_27854 [Gimesia maris DSM 8797]|nr:hypothetical protein PM8797T_27854 [Gimesia maris DSM 8797]|tara:strand:+ start:127998 stop:128132 length:135 start_codon:yes stop_codon:yes gene_type:complete
MKNARDYWGANQLEVKTTDSLAGWAGLKLDQLRSHLPEQLDSRL